MLTDTVVNEWRKPVLRGDPETVAHVVSDDRRAPRRSQPIMRIPALGLVFDEELGVLHLPNIVIVDARPGQKRVGADGQARCFRQVRNADRVCVRSGCLTRQLPQKRCVKIRQFKQGRICRLFSPILLVTLK